MKGLIYTILVIILLSIVGIVLLGGKKDDKSAASEDAANNTAATIPTNITTVDNSGATAKESEQQNSATQEVKVFDIEGTNFAFSQKEIRVKKGDRVRINFTSVDGFHDWVINEFRAATERVSSGEKTFVEFDAAKTGTFEYYCSVGSHRALGMVGKLIVE